MDHEVSDDYSISVMWMEFIVNLKYNIIKTAMRPLEGKGTVKQPLEPSRFKCKCWHLQIWTLLHTDPIWRGFSEQCTSRRHYSSCSLDIKQDCTGKQFSLTFKLVFVYFSSATLPSTGHEVGKFHDFFIAHLFDMTTRNHWGWKHCICSQPVLSDDPAKHCSLQIIS